MFTRPCRLIVDHGPGQQPAVHRTGLNQDLAVTPAAIYMAQVCAAVLKTDSGARQLNAVARSGGSNYDSTAQDVSETQKYIRGIFEEDPDTAAAC